MESGRNRQYTFRIFGLRFGFEFSPIVHADAEYMARWIVYFFGYTLRLHRFATGDERGPIGLHNHPFWFITFPLRSYREEYAVSPDEWPPVSEWMRDILGDGGWITATRTVRAFRFHFRGSNFRHRVLALERAPVWTIVLSGRYTQKWGFYPDPLTFIPYRSKKGTTYHEIDATDGQ